MFQMNSEGGIVPGKAERLTEEVEGSSHSLRRSQATGGGHALLEGEN